MRIVCGLELLLVSKKPSMDMAHEESHLYLPCVPNADTEHCPEMLADLLHQMLGIVRPANSFEYVKAAERNSRHVGVRQHIRIYRMELHPLIWTALPPETLQRRRLVRAHQDRLNGIMHPRDVPLAIS